LASLNATVLSVQGNTATIKTNQGIINGTITDIKNGVATIQTSLGTLTLSDLKNSSNTTGNYALAALALSIISLIILLAVAVQVFRKRK
jgi:hypothetical protein